MPIPRRLFIKGGLAAVMVAACGRTTELAATTAVAPATSTSLPAAPTAAPVVTSSGIDVMGEYSIVDATYGTEVTVTLDDAYRYITANGLPDHSTGVFPNNTNPNSISAQSYSVRLPRNPTQGPATPYNVPQSFGLGVNGVPFDPFAAEWFERDRNSGWQYEATAEGIDLGLDANNAHVQPTGAYHYHGIPMGLVGSLDAQSHSPLVGWAGDGFPIYVRYGYSDPNDPTSPIRNLASSYTIRTGERAGGPGGTYDGSFVEDYEYVAGLGDLDENNGRFAITPEYPQGIYQYMLTDAFPVIPRSFAGTLDPSVVLEAP